MGLGANWYQLGTKHVIYQKFLEKGYLWIKDTHLHVKDDTFKAGNIDILFLHILFHFWNVTCFVPNLVPIWPRSHGLRKQGMEQQHASSFDKDFAINSLKGMLLN